MEWIEYNKSSHCRIEKNIDSVHVIVTENH